MHPKYAGLLLGLALSACASLPDFHAKDPPEAERLARITRGLSRDEVSDLAGAPGNLVGASARPGAPWTYWYEDAWGYPSRFDVTFDASGRVSDTYSERLR